MPTSANIWKIFLKVELTDWICDKRCSFFSLRLCLLVIAQITKNFCFTSCQLPWSCYFICKSLSIPLYSVVVQHWRIVPPPQFPQQKYSNKSSSNHLSRLNLTHNLTLEFILLLYIDNYVFSPSLVKVRAQTPRIPLWTWPTTNFWPT